MNKLFLWLTGLLSPLWLRLGADPKALKLILAAKLKIDDRGGYVYGRQSSGRKSGLEYLVFMMVLLIGGILVALLFMIDHQPTAIGFAFSFWLIYIGLLLITEMSDNLFDLRDLNLLLTRPIGDVTFSLSRALHVATFTAKFALCLGFCLSIYFFFWEGILAFLIYLVVAILASILTVTGTLAIYLVLLRKVAAERVRKIIGYFQMVLVVIMFIAYQLPQLIDVTEDGGIAGIAAVGTLWGYSFPGFWLGALWGVLSGEAGSIHNYLQAGLAIAAVVLGTLFYVRQSRGYGSRLLALRQASSVSMPEPTTGKTSKGKGNYSKTLARWFTREGVERASFLFHWRIMSREMSFKQKVYPTLVFLPAAFFFPAVKDVMEEGSDFSDLPGQLLFMLYAFAMIVVIPLVQLRISERPSAAWVFDSLPKGRAGGVAYGQYMAVLLQLFLPIVLFLYPIILYLWGIEVYRDLLLSTAMILLIGFLFQVVDRRLPFSMSKESGQMNFFGPMMLVFFLMVVLGIAHWLLRGWLLGFSVAMITAWCLVLLAAFALRRRKA